MSKPGSRARNRATQPKLHYTNLTYFLGSTNKPPNFKKVPTINL